MTRPHTLRTARLELRAWQPADLDGFARLNADPEVMRYFPAPLSRQDSDHLAQRCQALIEARGWGFWAVASSDTAQFIGFIGLHVPAASLPCSPCVEVGWRLARPWWGRGLATEGAGAALRFGFEQLGLAEVVSFTSVHNSRSAAVMRRLGMRRDAATFLHPDVPVGHWLQEHCLYRLAAPMHRCN